MTDSNRRRRLAMLLLFGLAAAIVLWAVWPTPSPPAMKACGPVALREAIAAGQPQALQQALASIRSGAVAGGDLLGMLLADARWPCRAAVCRLAAEQADPRWLASALPRASDSDWRVRAAAFQMLGRFAEMPGPEPLKDTPPAERESLLLAWLDAYDRSGPAESLAAELCEVYANAQWVEFGRPLAGRCLNCHAGRAPAGWQANNDCASCHAAVYARWAGSAHAQSLLHLNLTTVNSKTRQVAALSFLPVRGIGCRECHRPLPGAKGQADPAAPQPDAERHASCPYRFDPAFPPTESCARCHAETHRQWRAWLTGSQPRLAEWPTGHLVTDHRGDTRSCHNCHMPAVSAAEPSAERTVADHRFAARRNVALLRRGLHVAVEPPPVAAAQGPVARHITLTNLAGHAWPTGTRRRALRLEAGPQPQSLTEVATLAPRRPGGFLTGSEPPLAPGEQRRLTVLIDEPVATLFWRLVYLRNAAEPNAYTAEIAAGRAPAGAWTRPMP